MLHICHAAPNTIHTVIIYVAVGDIAYPPLHCFHILSISRALSDDYFDDDVFARCMPYDDLVETRTWGVLEPNMIARVHHDRPDARLAVAVKRNSALVHIHTKQIKRISSGSPYLMTLSLTSLFQHRVSTCRRRATLRCSSRVSFERKTVKRRISVKSFKTRVCEMCVRMCGNLAEILVISAFHGFSG